MSRVVLSALVLAAIYLLVLTSLAPGDILIGGALGAAAAFLLRPRRTGPQPPLAGTLLAAADLIARTAVEMVVGSSRVVRFCLGGNPSPGFVEIPRGSRSDEEVAIWGLATGEAPDEIVVDVDETREVLVVHLVDAREPDAVRARHATNHGRWSRRTAG